MTEKAQFLRHSEAEPIKSRTKGDPYPLPHRNNLQRAVVSSVGNNIERTLWERTNSLGSPLKTEQEYGENYSARLLRPFLKKVVLE